MKEIKGYEGLYSIYEDGRIWSHKTNTFMRGTVGKKGYLAVTFLKKDKRKDYRVSRLVAMTFIPNPENKKEVNHKDGDKLNNNVKNLEWCTRSENMQHAFKNGLMDDRKGDKSHVKKLKKEDVKEIENMRSQGFMINTIANKFDVCRHTISNIIHKRTWKTNR